MTEGPTWADYNAAVANGLNVAAGLIRRRLEAEEREYRIQRENEFVPHPHEHTTHTLRDVIEALPRYERAGVSVLVASDTWPSGMRASEDGEYVKLSDVRAVVHKAAVLGAPVSPDAERGT